MTVYYFTFLLVDGGPERFAGIPGKDLEEAARYFEAIWPEALYVYVSDTPDRLEAY